MKKKYINDHEKQFLMDSERKLTVNKSIEFLKSKLNSKSTSNKMTELNEASELIDIALNAPKKKLSKIRRRFSRR